MDKAITPGAHADPWVNLLGGYVTEAVEALGAAGLRVDRSWLDPCDPRDATIRLADSTALVFDEVTGWRYGTFLAGQPGVRTCLADVKHVGGGVLLDPRKLAHRVSHRYSTLRREFRSVTDLHDGLDEALRLRGLSRVS